nr:immunoglobulin heavy chain junction region [Mus musculus]
CARELGPFAYW